MVYHLPFPNSFNIILFNQQHKLYYLQEKWSKEVVTKKWKIGVVENYVDESRKQKEINQPQKKKTKKYEQIKKKENPTKLKLNVFREIKLSSW